MKNKVASLSRKQASSLESSQDRSSMSELSGYSADNLSSDRNNSESLTADSGRKINISRDEMNLSEFPLTVLSTRASSTIKTLEFNDTIRGKNGETVNRSWIITGADKFGLPTSSDDEVLLGLLKLTVDSQFTSRKIVFSRYELLKNLRWSTEGRSYSRLQKALDRLSGVRIKATNAFYDNELKSHSTKNFGIIDGYELNDGRDNDRPSFFSWSEVIFRSFQSGFIKKLDLDFYLALKSSVSKRLYRFLDKHFWYRSKIQMNFFVFAHEKIGISRTYQFVSSMRQQLDPALDELIECGFIKSYEYLGQGKGTEIIILAASGKPRVLGTAQSTTTQRLESQELTRELESAARNYPSSSAPQLSKIKTIGGMLTQRGISAQQVERLLSGIESESLDRIEKIIQHFDYLVTSQSLLVSKNPIGFLYRAVQNPQKFQLPSDKGSKKIRSTSNTQQTSLNIFSKQENENDRTSALKAKYLVERKQEVSRLKSEVERELVARIRKDVESALHKLRSLISESRFQEAVEHGVEEKLAKLFAFPEFEEWIKGKTKRILQ